MSIFTVIAILITLAAAFSYVNHRTVRLPTSIALMLMSLIVAAALLGAKHLGGAGGYVEAQAERLVRQVDFHEVLLGGMLPLLLFAAALHVNLDDLARNKWSIGTFATVGVAGSTLLVAAMVYALSCWMRLPLGWIECLLFGALISPTDPIAVLGILRKADAPKSLETRIVGESLFNDGIGVVVFLSLLGLAGGGPAVSPAGAAKLFVVEVMGGLALGLALGWAAYRLLKSIDNYRVEVLLTLALVLGGYALAAALHVSGPLAVVVAGLLIGNRGRRLAMSEKTREHLDTFWELIDEILNAVLFVLIGLEVLVLAEAFNATYLLAGAVAVPIVLLARLVSIGVPVGLLSRRRPFAPRAVRILTWGGLRGGISVALALSLPAALGAAGTPGAPRELILTMTYVVVAFSILVQGLTIKRFIAAGPAKKA